MAASSSARMHSGELEMHRLLGVPAELSQQMPSWPSKTMNEDRRLFFESIPYLGLGTLDEERRPWASLFVGTVECPGPNEIILSDPKNIADPFFRNVAFQEDGAEDQIPWAGVGVMFHNRRRNKVEGRLENRARFRSGKSCRVQLAVDNTMGNCPKYINVRHLRVVDPPHDSEVEVLRGKRQALPKPALATIAQADTLYLATRHWPNGAGPSEATMDVNHRGGSRGFARISADGLRIFYPEYSGNRIYSSLGNIVSDGVAGICFPNFDNGDVLYVTGNARVLVGESSLDVMPRAEVSVELEVQEWVWVAGGLGLRADPAALVQSSPYNPIIRFLRTELEGGVKREELLSEPAELEFVRATQLTPTISTFRFRVPSGSLNELRAGQYATIDCSSLRGPRTYSHMSPDRPQAINDDFIRTWTISNFVGKDDREIDITVKLAPKGAVSFLLHAKANKLQGLRLLGTGGEFCSRPEATALVWIAAGSGVTPFMAMMQAKPTLRPRMLLSLRLEDVPMAAPFCADTELTLFITDGSPTDADFVAGILGSSKPHLVFRRMQQVDVANVAAEYSSATFWVCGPDNVMDFTSSILQQARIANVVLESFRY